MLEEIQEARRKTGMYEDLIWEKLPPEVQEKLTEIKMGKSFLAMGPNELQKVGSMFGVDLTNV